MIEATIAHSNQDPLADDLSSSENGCLVKIYPTEGPAGLWTLGSAESVLGRVSECDIQLEDDSASRKHAKVWRDEDGCFIADLGSTNGTFVNDERITQQRLEAGDRIRIGSHILKFLSADHIELQYHETVYRMTTTDGLTAAYNKQYLLECMEREMIRSSRHDRPLSLLMMDIDFFKKVNDTYGHLAGDQVLQEFSRRIKSVLQRDDVLARYGGEEFAVVLSDADTESACRVAERIRQSIESRPFETSSQTIAITTSIGVATIIDGEINSTEDFIGIADERLYKAKESGRNRVCSA
ncbi:MAG: GGDEF domain-containing protein [Planctomycetota bacterium]